MNGPRGAGRVLDDGTSLDAKAAFVDESALGKTRPRWFTHQRIALYSGVLLICQAGTLGVLAIFWLYLHNIPPFGWDFRVFWSTSFLSIHDSAIAAFDPRLLRAIEMSIGPNMPMKFAPWVYPPSFQLFVYPLALLPYTASYLLCMAVGVVLCIGACRFEMKNRPLPWVTVLAFPALWINALAGQNSFLTMALAAGAFGLVRCRPVLAGFCAGLLVIKPQLAMLLPLCFLCGRHFKAFAAMAVTAAVLCLLSAMVFGVPLWLKFFGALAAQGNAKLLNNADDSWRAMPTLYATARRLGAGSGLAYGLDALVALPAMAVTALLWFRRADRALCAAAGVVTTMLMQPYLLYYDLTWLLLAIIYLCEYGSRSGAAKSVANAAYGTAAVMWFLPLGYFMAVFNAPVFWPFAVCLLAALPISFAFFLLRVFRNGIDGRSDVRGSAGNV